MNDHHIKNKQINFAQMILDKNVQVGDQKTY